MQCYAAILLLGTLKVIHFRNVLQVFLESKLLFDFWRPAKSMTLIASSRKCLFCLALLALNGTVTLHFFFFESVIFSTLDAIDVYYLVTCDTNEIFKNYI